jgi:hypothetical protein
MGINIILGKAERRKEPLKEDINFWLECSGDHVFIMGTNNVKDDYIQTCVGLNTKTGKVIAYNAHITGLPKLTT